MILLLIIYLLGCIVSFILDYRYTLDKYEEVKLNDLGCFFIISLFSWISAISGIFIYYGGKIVVHKKFKKIPTKWTATDKEKVEEIKNALFRHEKEHFISYDVIEWLNNLKYRI